ncbi:MAG: T9SS C-terminal target domain-containing protein [Bacteroidetes bacterium]|nr:MAG: T9SS C-terminal target domain-containing protein [Bacteroidota bacterium]
MKLRAIFYVLCILSRTVLAQDNPVTLRVGENYRLYPGSVNQTEVFIVNSPLNQDILFSACNTLNFIPFFISEGIFVTTDGGQNWRGNDTCTGEPIAFHGGDPGIVIDKNGTFILTRLGRSPFVGLYSHYSTDNGQTWSSQQVISTDDLERASLISDTHPSSTYYGRTYAAWVKFAPPFPLSFSFTDDGATSWSIPVPVNNPTHRSSGGDLAMGPNGEIYACWAGVTDVTPFKEIQVGFAVSATGGSDWNVIENAFPVNGITGILPNKDNIRVNGLPTMDVDLTDGPRQGWIYIVTGQKDLPPAGHDPDIILNRSTDGGISWSAGIRVNQDPLNNGKDQYFPSVHVDHYGGVNVIFYDDRNTTTDSTGVFLARSTDGGDTWKEVELSDHNFKPTPIGGLGQGYQGDNIDITSADSTLWPVWMDNSTGIYQIWTSPVAFSSIQAIDGPFSDVGFKIYPNPTTGITNYELRITKEGDVSLELFNLTGELEKTLLDGRFGPGLVKGSFDAGAGQDKRQFPPGVYLVRITVSGRSTTKKLVFLE